MFTAEEKQQIQQLEEVGCKTLFETNIKEVAGGYIIAHQVSYVLDGEVKGVTREQLVAANHYAVTDTISSLYGCIEKDEPTAVFPDFDPSKHVHDGDTFLDRVQAAVNQPTRQAIIGVPKATSGAKLQEPYYPAEPYDTQAQLKMQAAAKQRAAEAHTAKEVNPKA